MTQHTNTNPKFGDEGPFEAESKEALADEMASKFEFWAGEEYSSFEHCIQMSRVDYIAEASTQLRLQFLDGLKEI